MMALFQYVGQLADKLQKSWELDQKLHFRNLADTCGNESTRRNCIQILRYMDEGIWNFGRHYHADVKDGEYRVLFTEKVSGMPKIHCVINPETGDLARYSTELINESCFQFNLLDRGSRMDCLAVAEYSGEYLN